MFKMLERGQDVLCKEPHTDLPLYSRQIYAATVVIVQKAH